MEEVHSSVNQPLAVVDASYQDLASKLETMELQQVERASLPFRHSRVDDASTSIEGLNLQWDRPCYTFESSSKASQVYRRIAPAESLCSGFSKESHTTKWSILSGLSLADVPNISVISLAITLGEVYNPFLLVPFHPMANIWR